MPGPTTTTDRWTPWVVARESGFEAADAGGDVHFSQLDPKRFLVRTPFRFSDERVQRDLVERLRRRGMAEEDAVRAVEDARTFTPSVENPTDFASIPPFVRWFENSYGRHTLAAILHDDLIVEQTNGGALRSDTLADRFFREMLRRAGVPWLKRWIMWAAVAVRTRWAAGGLRRSSLCLWTVLALLGIASFVSATATVLLGRGDLADVRLPLTVALVLPFVSGALWGRQFGASLVAAVAAIWILPAAAFAVLGFLVYQVLERVARHVGLQ